MSAKRKSSGRPRAADSLAPDAPLSEVASRLALAAPLAPAPSPRVKETLLARIRALQQREKNAPPAGWRFDSVESAEGWCKNVFPGVSFKTLSVDERRDSVMVLIKMGPGARFPDHDHADGADEGIVLSGDVITGGRMLRAGDYYHAAAGSTHVDTVSPSGCTALVTLTNGAWMQWRQLAAARE